MTRRPLGMSSPELKSDVSVGDVESDLDLEGLPSFPARNSSFASLCSDLDAGTVPSPRPRPPLDPLLSPRQSSQTACSVAPMAPTLRSRWADLPRLLGSDGPRDLLLLLSPPSDNPGLTRPQLRPRRLVLSSSSLTMRAARSSRSSARAPLSGAWRRRTWDFFRGTDDDFRRRWDEDDERELCRLDLSSDDLPLLVDKLRALLRLPMLCSGESFSPRLEPTRRSTSAIWSGVSAPGEISASCGRGWRLASDEALLSRLLLSLGLLELRFVFRLMLLSRGLLKLRLRARLLLLPEFRSSSSSTVDILFFLPTPRFSESPSPVARFSLRDGTLSSRWEWPWSLALRLTLPPSSFRDGLSGPSSLRLRLPEWLRRREDEDE
mmetsp:Transcript_22458/g.50950  ORF Transcript_22458/g.50950 Transcript_22458/m.50950 type:complete len:378 (+) Transcript_22458:157-1290(+)